METIVLMDNAYFKLVKTISYEGIEMYEVRSAKTNRVYYNTFYRALADRFYDEESEAMYQASQE